MRLNGFTKSLKISRQKNFNASVRLRCDSHRRPDTSSSSSSFKQQKQRVFIKKSSFLKRRESQQYSSTTKTNNNNNVITFKPNSSVAINYSDITKTIDSTTFINNTIKETNAEIEENSLLNKPI